MPTGTLGEILLGNQDSVISFEKTSRCIPNLGDGRSVITAANDCSEEPCEHGMFSLLPALTVDANVLRQRLQFRLRILEGLTLFGVGKAGDCGGGTGQPASYRFTPWRQWPMHHV